MGALIFLLFLMIVFCATIKAAINIDSAGFILVSGLVILIIFVMFKQISKSAKIGNHIEIFSSAKMKRYYEERSKITAKRYSMMLQHNVLKERCLWKDTQEGQAEQNELNILDEKYAIPGTINYAKIRRYKEK